MFAKLKNKIKEETGNEVPRLFARPRSPRQGSVSSVSSVISSEVDGDVNCNKQNFASKDSTSAKEKELIMKLERTEKEHALILEQKERHFKLQIEEKERELQEQMTSLQNNMQSAQAVWSGEAAAARREARDEIRRNSVRVDQLAAATAAASRAQDRLDELTEEIESERRAWAIERVRLATEAENALHRLSLLEIPSADENNGEENPKEAFLKRKLEETQLHLHDIKTSWSSQIASLETQVGRLSRQAGEEGSERRRIEKERDLLLEKLKEKEIQLEQAQATLEDKDAKMALLAAEIGEASRIGREARFEVNRQRDKVESLTNKLSEIENKLAMSEEKNNSLESENSNLKETISRLEKTKADQKKEIYFLNNEKKQWQEEERKLKETIKEQVSSWKIAETEAEDEKRKCSEMSKETESMKTSMKSLKEELNDIHDRYDKERRDKDESLLRNAHMSQTLEIYRQEMRQQETEIADYKSKISNLEKTIADNVEDIKSVEGLRKLLEEKHVEIEMLKHEKDEETSSKKQLQNTINDLNSQISEKTKNIRILQNRLADMKKTLQREIRGGQVDPLGSSVVEGTTEDPDVSKKYLKHVLIKFLTSREMEARQLTRAVGALLGLSEQEENLLKETLAWRSSFSAWISSNPPRLPHS